MSELKYQLMLNKEMSWVPCYLKSEADKVIAEKDKEIQRLENLCESYRIDCDNLAIREANAYKEIERDNKQIRHHKYKRCMAMAKYCEERYRYLTCLENWQMTDKEYQQVIGDYWDKWHKRWLELAEKFNLNKSTAQ